MTQVPHQFLQNFQQPGDHRLLSTLGLVPGAELTRFIGSNPTVGTVQAHLWNAGGLYPWPTTAETLDIVSDDAGDTLLGLGARTVIIDGLDGNFDRVLVPYDMAGLGTVTTTELFQRVNNVIVGSVGTYGGANLGTITVTNSGSAQLLAEVTPGIGGSRMGHYTIRNGKRAVLIRLVTTPEGSKNINVFGYVRPDADVVAAPFGPRVEALFFPNLAEPLPLSDIVGSIIQPKTDFWAEVQTVSGNGAATINFGVMLFD